MNLKHWRGTHNLDVCSAILVRFWSAQTWESNSQTGTYIQPFSSVVLICLNRDSPPGCVFSHFYQIWRVSLSNSQTGCMFSHSHQWFWSTQTLERDLHPRHVFSLSCHSDLLKLWRVTHTLDACLAFLNGSDLSWEWLTFWIHVQPFLSVVLIH